MHWKVDLFDTKGFKGRRIDWLVWRLTTTIAHHYMHTLKMKKKGFIKNKVVEAIVTRNVEKATFIPLTHVDQLILESDEAWGVQSQHFSQHHLCNKILIHRNILFHM